MPGERQGDLVFPARCIDCQNLAETAELDIAQVQIPAPLAHGQHLLATLFGNCQHAVSLVLRRVHDHRAAAGQKLAEQAQLGLQVFLFGGVIVHVITAKVGETGGHQFHPVQPVLIEPMAGRFHCGMSDTGIGQLRQFRMQRNRVRRRQPAIAGAGGCHRPKRAEAGRIVAATLEDLADKIGNGGLSAGAGDGHHGFRLAPMKAGSHLRKRQTRVRGDDDWYRHAALGLDQRRTFRIRQNSGRALLHRLCGKACAMGLYAAKGKKQKARPSRPAVRGQSPDHEGIIRNGDACARRKCS